MNRIYLFIYTVELGARIYACRWDIIHSSWDMFDAVIVCVGFFSEVFGGLLPSPGILRLVRLVRVAKALRIIQLPQELDIMVHGFVSALKAIFIGVLLVFVLMTIWGVIAVEVFYEESQKPDVLQRYI